MRLFQFLEPFLYELDATIDKRPVRMLLQTVEAIVVFRDRNNGLLLSQLGGYLDGVGRGGTKRLSTLIHHRGWQAQQIEEFLLQRADRQVAQWEAWNQDGLLIWDGSASARGGPALYPLAHRARQTLADLSLSLCATSRPAPLSEQAPGSLAHPRFPASSGSGRFLAAIFGSPATTWPFGGQRRLALLSLSTSFSRHAGYPENGERQRLSAITSASPRFRYRWRMQN